jgi:hypothetical protein
MPITGAAKWEVPGSGLVFQEPPAQACSKTRALAHSQLVLGQPQETECFFHRYNKPIQQTDVKFYRGFYLAINRKEQERTDDKQHTVDKLSKQPVIASARQLPGEAIRMRGWIAGARCAPWR